MGVFFRNAKTFTYGEMEMVVCMSGATTECRVLVGTIRRSIVAIFIPIANPRIQNTSIAVWAVKVAGVARI